MKDSTFKKLKAVKEELYQQGGDYLILYEEGEDALTIYQNIDYETALILAADLIVKHNINVEDLILVLDEATAEAGQKRNLLLKKEMNLTKKMN